MRALLLLAGVLAAAGSAAALGTGGSYWTGHGSGLDPLMPSGPFVGTGIAYGVGVAGDGGFGASTGTNSGSCWCGPTEADQKFHTAHGNGASVRGDPSRGVDGRLDGSGFLSDQPYTAVAGYGHATYARAGPGGVHANSNEGAYVPPTIGPQVHTCVNAAPDLPHGLGANTSLGDAPTPLGAHAGQCSWEGWG